MKKVVALLCTAIASLALAAVAEAHVTVHPNALPSGGFTIITIRVPNERPKAATTKVDVQFPAGFYFVSYQAMPGWRTKILYRTLAKPVTVFGEKVTQEVAEVIFTGKLPAGQFIEFPLSVAIPALKPGALLTFKALQTYSNGEIVRWIGPPSADEPAPQVMVANANSAAQDYPAGIPAIKKARKTQGLTPAQGAIVAVPLLALAGIGLVRRRRNRA
jgi:MYXO-CTERM domain-containing protein